MKLIAGLGNPGKKYEKNRHNIGFMVADAFAVGAGLEFKKSLDLMCYFAKNSDFVLVKPTTFMNVSGEAVAAVSNFYKVEPEDVLIIHDDLDLEFGEIRLSHNGSSGGHRGVESAIKRLATVDFNRLRIGIGHPRDQSDIAKVEDYVLSDFTPQEQKELDKIIKKCQEAIVSYLDEGLEATMNLFN